MAAWARRTDSTHREVVDTLRRCGWTVADTSRLSGFVDAVAWKGDTVRLVEIKTGKGKHTASQRKLLEQGCPIVTLTSAEQAAQLR